MSGCQASLFFNHRSSVSFAKNPLWEQPRLSYDLAILTLPLICGFFYFSRGLLAHSLDFLSLRFADQMAGKSISDLAPTHMQPLSGDHILPLRAKHGPERNGRCPRYSAWATRFTAMNYQAQSWSEEGSIFHPWFMYFFSTKLGSNLPWFKTCVSGFYIILIYIYIYVYIVHYCTLLYIIVHYCTLLYIIVHYCTLFSCIILVSWSGVPISKPTYVYGSTMAIWHW